MRLPDINDLIQDLQLAKQIAIHNQNANALTIATIATIATMSQAKLLGIDKPQIKDIYSANKPTVFNITGVSPDDYSMLTDNELRQLQVITKKMDKVVTHG